MRQSSIVKLNNKSKSISLLSSNYFLINSLIIILLAGTVRGHISSFVNSEGKPNSINTRVIRGPQKPQPRFNPDLPSFQQASYGITNKNLGDFSESMDRDEYWKTRSNSYPGESTIEGSDEALSEDSDYDEENVENGSLFHIPYVSAQALANLPMFFKHLQNNIMALQKEQDEETPTGFKGRWQPPASGLINVDRQRQNNRNFFETPSHRGNFMRRAANNYNPGWKYTKLGLGRKRR